MSKPRILHFWLKYIASPQDTDCRLRLTRKICFTEWDSCWWYFGDWRVRGGVLNKNTKYGQRKEQVGCWSDGPQSKPSNKSNTPSWRNRRPLLIPRGPQSNEKEPGSPTTYKIKVCTNLLLNFKQGSTKGCVWNTELSASLFRLLGLQMGKLRPCRQKEAGRGLIWWLPNEPSSLSLC